MMATNEKMMEAVHLGLRESKKVLFSILNTSYEQQKEGLTKEFHKIRDNIDILLDEVKVSHAKWPDRYPEEFLEMIIMHDSEILRGIPKLNESLKEIEKKIMAMALPGTSLSDREQLTWLQAKTDSVNKQSGHLARLLKEREMLLNVRKFHSEREYEDIRREAETSI